MVKNYAVDEGYQYEKDSESKYCVKFKLGDKSIVSEEIQFSMTGDAITVKLGDYLKNKYNSIIMILMVVVQHISCMRLVLIVL